MGHLSLNLLPSQQHGTLGGFGSRLFTKHSHRASAPWLWHRRHQNGRTLQPAVAAAAPITEIACDLWQHLASSATQLATLFPSVLLQALGAPALSVAILDAALRAALHGGQGPPTAVAIPQPGSLLLGSAGPLAPLPGWPSFLQFRDDSPPRSRSATLDRPRLPGLQPPPPPPRSPNSLSIVMVGAECAPWSKTGGLGDVMQALPKALAAKGHRVMVVVPRYKDYEGVRDSGARLRMRVFNSDQEVTYFHTFADGVDWVFVDHSAYHSLGQSIYGGDNLTVIFRCALLCKAALEAPWHVPCGGAPYGEHNLLFIANDWHAALLPVYLQVHYRDFGKLRQARSTLVLHNIAHQGRAAMADLSWLEIPDLYQELFRFRATAEYDEHMNIMQAGALSAHRIVTVSKTYASEVQSKEHGWGLEGMLQTQAWKLRGVVNGIDYNEWHPAIDPHLQGDGYCNYDIPSLVEGKARCKAALQKELGLPVDPDAPLLGFIGRLDSQKGVDLILESYEYLMAQGAQLVLLGSGREDLEQALKDMEQRSPNQCKAWVGFSVKLAHRITAGVDLLLMPSRFEPCGLNQLYAMAYGTPPIVHGVGGLRDTVHPHCPYKNTGTGWRFEVPEAAAFQEQVGYALLTYREYKDSFRGVQLRGMEQDLGWDSAAQQYEDILFEAKAQAPSRY